MPSVEHVNWIINFRVLPPAVFPMFSHTVKYLKRSVLRHQHVPRYIASNESNSKLTLEDAFAALGLDMNSSPEECRQSYLRLAKQLHPDSVTAPSNESPGRRSAAFQHIHEAYQIAYSAATRAQNEQPLNMDNHLQEPVLHHRAPQHRQYLETDCSYLGSAIVSGLTPSERQKQLQTQRFVRGVYESADYRLERLQEDGMIFDSMEATTDIAPVNRHKYGRKPVKKKSINLIERIADELIEESMRRGEFDNLQGHGKPLPERSSHTELFVDRSTHKLTQILANQGYLPEWIQQGKELRMQWETAVHKLRVLHARLENPQHNAVWKKAVLEFHEEAKRINRSIDRYNLMVPALHLQRCHVNASSMVREILLQSKETSPEKNNTRESSESGPPPNAEDDADEGIRQDQTPEEDSENGDKKLWDPRYLGELMRDFYRELARAYVSMMRGFKNHR